MAATLVALSAPLVVRLFTPLTTPADAPPVLVRFRLFVPPVTAPRVSKLLPVLLSTTSLVSVVLP